MPKSNETKTLFYIIAIVVVVSIVLENLETIINNLKTILWKQ